MCKKQFPGKLPIDGKLPNQTYAYSFRGQAVKSNENGIDIKAIFDPEMFFNIILPPIIFYAGYSLKRVSLPSNWIFYDLFLLFFTNLRRLMKMMIFYDLPDFYDIPDSPDFYDFYDFYDFLDFFSPNVEILFPQFRSNFNICHHWNDSISAIDRFVDVQCHSISTRQIGVYIFRYALFRCIDFTHCKCCCYFFFSQFWWIWRWIDLVVQATNVNWIDFFSKLR